MMAQTNRRRKRKTKQEVPFSKNDSDKAFHSPWMEIAMKNLPVLTLGPAIHKQLCCWPSCLIVVTKLVSLNWIFIIILSLSSTFRKRNFFFPSFHLINFSPSTFCSGEMFYGISTGLFHSQVESIVVDSSSLSCQTLHSSWHLQKASKVCLLLVILKCNCSHNFQ